MAAENVFVGNQPAIESVSTVDEPVVTTLHARNVGAAIVGAFRGEQIHGKYLKEGLRHELLELIGSNYHYQSDTHAEDTELLARKLLRFRPRLVGAIGAYAHLTGQTYEQVIAQGGIENFYLFWALGSIQDDFIDTIPKQMPGTTDVKERQAQVAQSIFGNDRRFYRAAYHLLRRHIKGSDLGTEQTQYALDKIAGWYKLLIRQEAEVLATPFEDLTFDYCRTYREEQNMRAGTTLVALLNGKNCLGPAYQDVEPEVAKFSFMTQIIDDIADTSEDLGAQRPSYAVGALNKNPQELQDMQAYLISRPNIKVTPRIFRSVAPESYSQIHGTFVDYADGLSASASKGIASIGTKMFRYFPHIRNILFRIDPKYANF